MDREEFRKKLIKLLKESKIYYIDFYGNINEVFDSAEISKEIQEQKDFLYNLRYLNSISHITTGNSLQDSANYNFMIDQQIHDINRLEGLNTLKINEDSTLDEIAEVISGICDDVDYSEFNDSTILSRFKKEKSKGLKYENDFIKKYSKK